MHHRDLGHQVIRTARAMEERGLSRGLSGNVSARVPEGLLITPTAMPYDRLEPEGLSLITLDGERLDGGAPSTEWRLHARVLGDRRDVGAVLHAHAPFCTALACVRRHIPAFHYMVAVAGGDSIRCAGYAPFGSPELADLAVAALEDRTACLLANHGMVALGESPDAALERAAEVEWLAATYWRALQVGEPVVLSAEEMSDVRARFGRYRGEAPGA